MPHPIQFDDDDPWLARLRALALAYPRAEEVVSHGRPTFRVGKIFCLFGSEQKQPAGTRVPHPAAVVVKVDPAELPALDEDPRFFLPRYWASFGWRGLDLDAPGVDAGEVAELVDASYRLVAPRRALAELEERTRQGSAG
ncbi:MmcQ/YjbR family DNA-binding protein [Nocardioides sp. ChNu-153]|uniref:MmcQ/YjbR family DNA-binding protein n=1 Tax=Nocardioides sp. ChNu-153 TaxID=2779364 RepID=UPI00264E24E0|nr:MmcQ/YjbR family DNA-binding protein [Nocardioides sp. ChNu-153]MDN7119994.1 MmcQ/YjbR family DNA-binding protein [Nocardioides sp. ChNu-153]